MELEEKFEANGDYSTCVPEGWYLCGITKADLTPTKKVGRAIVIDFSILEGEHRQQKCSIWCNYYHDNALTRSIAKQQLAKICLAAGIEELTDTDQLLNKILQVQFAITTYNGTKRNEPKAFAAQTDQVAQPVSAGDTWS